MNIDISKDFDKPDLAQWQEAAMKSLKLDELEKLEKKLNQKTCEGISLKTNYENQKREINLNSFPAKRGFARFVKNSTDLSSDFNGGVKYFILDKPLKKKGEEWFFQVVKKTEQDFFGDEILLDLFSLFLNLDSDLEKTKEYIAKSLLNEKTRIYINTSIIHNAGGSSVQELWTALELALFAVENFNYTKTIAFEISLDSLFFTNIAKLRAFRFLWESMISQLDLQAKEFFIISKNSVREQSLFDPWVNMLRNTSSCSSAFLGGADLLTVDSFESLKEEFSSGELSEMGLKQSRNILHILDEESSLSKVLDPGKGSYAIEELTAELAEKTLDKLKTSHKSGGIFSDIKKLSEDVAEIARERFVLVQKRKHVLAGVNNFANINDDLEDIYGENLSISEPSGLFPLRRQSNEFESLRLAVKGQKNRKIKLLAIGTEAKLSARIMFCKNFFEVLGIECEAEIQGLDQINYQVKDELALVVCSADENYQTVFNHIDLPQNIPCFVAGKAFEHEKIDNIYMGQNVYELLFKRFVKGELK